MWRISWGSKPLLMALLRSVATLAIDDSWIGAGIVRNAVETA